MDQSRPLVSVIIPTYNRVKPLEKAIKSVLAQGPIPLEILVIDDGSTDDTEAMVRALARRYGSIRYLRNRRTKGPAGARNTGLLCIQGEFTAFLDSDDLWLPGHLENAIDLLVANPQIDLLFGNLHLFDQPQQRLLTDWGAAKQRLAALDKVPLGWSSERIADPLFLALVDESFVLLSSVVMRSMREQTLLFNEMLGFSEDRDLIIRLERLKSFHFAYRHAVSVVRRENDGNLTNKHSLKTHRQILEAHLTIYREYIESFPLNEDEHNHLLDLIHQRLISISYTYRELGDYFKAFRSAADAFMMRPGFPPIVQLAKTALRPVACYRTE